MKPLLAFTLLVGFAQAQPIQNGPTIVPRPAGAQIKVPAGFSVDEYAGGFTRPRFMVEGQGGEVIVSDTTPTGSVIAVRAGEKKTLISGLDRPYGLGLWKEYLYVAEPETLKRYKYDSKALTAGPGEEDNQEGRRARCDRTRLPTFAVVRIHQPFTRADLEAVRQAALVAHLETDTSRRDGCR